MLKTTTLDVPGDIAELLRGYVDAAERGGRLLRRPSRFVAERGAQARAVLERGTCTAVHVVHDTAPAVVRHEHGLLVLVPQEGAVQLLDVSSVDGDPRWELHETGRLMRREWRWMRVGELGTHAFTASGDGIVPIDLGDLHGTALEAYLTDRDEGWPGDDATLPLTLAEVVALAGAGG